MLKRAAGAGADVLEITIEEGVTRTVCRLVGELDAENIGRLRAVLGERLDAQRDAVVDLAGLRFIDSSGLGALVGALKRYQAAGHTLALRSPTTALQRVLETTGLASAFPIEY